MSIALLLTLSLGLAALVLIIRAGAAALIAARADAAENGSIGRRYDALHEAVTVVGTSWDATGPPRLDLRYGSAHIVYLDYAGRPETAQVTGAGAMVVHPKWTPAKRWSTRVRRRPEFAVASVIERGVLTTTGRVVHECYLSPPAGRLLPARITAASSFSPVS